MKRSDQFLSDTTARAGLRSEILGSGFSSASRVHGSSVRRVFVLLMALGLQLDFAAQSAVSDSEDFKKSAAKNWPTVGGDWYNTRYSRLGEINKNNVQKLGAAWVSETFDEGARSSVTPVVEDGVMFVTAGRKVHALNAKTGEKLWSYKTVPDAQAAETLVQSRKGPNEMPTLPTAVPNSKGIAVSRSLIFVGLVDGNVIALKKRTGELVWIRQTGTDAPKPLQRVSGAPVYVDGVVLTGLANGDANLRGRITALEAESGKQLWQMFTVPGPGESGHETWPSFNDTWRFGGGGVWTNAAVDVELGIAYFTTGNPVPAFAGDWRPGNNLYTCSVLAIDIKTGKLKWYYQLVHHDVFEADVGTPVVLYDLQQDSRSYKALAVLRSDGYLFQLDRRTGNPILPIEERAVPQLRSQRTSPTQPFPVGGESILMSCEDWRKERIPTGFVLGCMWTPPASPPPSEDPQNVLAPFPSARISPMTYSPLTGYFYAQTPSVLGWPRRSQDPYHLTFGTTVSNLKSYSELVAVDSRTGKIAWRKPLQTKARSAIDLTGGLLTTAGGLVFRSSSDGNVEGYDARTGDILWRYQTGMLDARGSPVSYEIDGEQYLAVPMGSTVWGFKLEGKIPAASTPDISSLEEEFSGPVVDTRVIETISLKRSSFASVTRYFIDEFAFNPSRARVTAGTRVMFVNNGNMRHEIVASDGSWGTGPLSPAQEAWVGFDKSGEYTYHCKNHPWTHGQVIVDLDAPSQIEDPWNGEHSVQSMNSFAVQATTGKEQFNQHCSSCHGEGMSGQAMAPTLFGDAFVLRWRGATVGDLFDRIRTTMPPANPGSLHRKTYLNIVAHLLRGSSLAPGSSELKDNPEELKSMIVGKTESTPLNQ